MALQGVIEQDMKDAMRGKEELRLSVLRMLRASLHNRAIEKRAKTGSQELSEEEVIAAVRSEVKKRKDAIAEFQKAGRRDLAEKEAREQIMLEKYLPQEISDEEIEKLLQPLAAGASEKDFGRIMGAAMKMVAGRASGDRVSAIVKQLFAKED